MASVLTQLEHRLTADFARYHIRTQALRLVAGVGSTFALQLATGSGNLGWKALLATLFGIAVTTARQLWPWIFSYGGTQDALIDITRDRVADVFPDEEAIEAAGFSSQEDSDLLAAFGPPKVGIPANNFPHLKKLLGQRSMSQMQAEHEAAQAARRERQAAAQQQ